MSQEKDSRQYIKIRGANAHNLKNIDVDIPRDKLVVLTGLSGSGKSSLAFDTILLCKTVLGTDGKAGRRKHRGAFPGDFH